MGELVPTPHLTEPQPIDCHFVEGLTVEVREEFIRVVGWIDLETVEDGQPERRIVVRAAIPLAVARLLVRDLRHVLVRGRN